MNFYWVILASTTSAIVLHVPSSVRLQYTNAEEAYVTTELNTNSRLVCASYCQKLIGCIGILSTSSSCKLLSSKGTQGLPTQNFHQIIEEYYTDFKYNVWINLRMPISAKGYILIKGTIVRLPQNILLSQGGTYPDPRNETALWLDTDGSCTLANNNMGVVDVFPFFTCDTFVSEKAVLKVEFPDAQTTKITMNGGVSHANRVADFEYLSIIDAFDIEIIEIKY